MLQRMLDSNFGEFSWNEDGTRFCVGIKLCIWISNANFPMSLIILRFSHFSQTISFYQNKRELKEWLREESKEFPTSTPTWTSFLFPLMVFYRSTMEPFTSFGRHEPILKLNILFNFWLVIIFPFRWDCLCLSVSTTRFTFQKPRAKQGPFSWVYTAILINVA